MHYLPYEGLYDGPSSELPNDDAYDNHDMIINAEVMLPHNGEHMQAARVVGRSKSSDGTFTGTYNENPILDTRVFDVQFPDGSISQYTTNMIIQNIFSRIRDGGVGQHRLIISIDICWIPTWNTHHSELIY